MQAQPVSTPGHDTTAHLFRHGFLLMLPLWAGAIPSGLAYGIAAGQVGLSPLDTQLMSLLVFTSAGQISAVALIGEGTRAWLVFGTVLAVNIQLLLIGVTIRRQVRASRAAMAVTGWFLTDAAYALAAASGKLRLPVLTGAGASMYLGWNIGTAFGIVAGNAIPDPERFGLDLVIPLAFLAVLAPQLRSRPAVLVAVVAAAVALAVSSFAPGGIAVLAAGVIGGASGAVAVQQRGGAV